MKSAATNLLYREGLELDGNATIDLAPREVVGHSILLARDVRDPIVAVDIVDAKEVEAVQSQPHIAEDGLLVALVVVKEAVAHTNIGTLIGWRTEGIGLQFFVGSRERQTIGKSKAEAHPPLGRTREVVGKEEVDGITLVRGQGDEIGRAHV